MRQVLTSDFSETDPTQGPENAANTMTLLPELPVDLFYAIFDAIAGPRGRFPVTDPQFRGLRAGRGDLGTVRRLASTCQSLRGAYVSWTRWLEIARPYHLEPDAGDGHALALFEELRARDLHVCETCCNIVNESYAVEVSPDVRNQYCLHCVSTVWDKHEYVRETSFRSASWEWASTSSGSHHNLILALYDRPHRRDHMVCSRFRTSRRISSSRPPLTRFLLSR